MNKITSHNSIWYRIISELYHIELCLVILKKRVVLIEFCFPFECLSFRSCVVCSSISRVAEPGLLVSQWAVVLLLLVYSAAFPFTYWSVPTAPKQKHDRYILNTAQNAVRERLCCECSADRSPEQRTMVLSESTPGWLPHRHTLHVFIQYRLSLK